MNDYIKYLISLCLIIFVIFLGIEVRNINDKINHLDKSVKYTNNLSIENTVRISRIPIVIEFYNEYKTMCEKVSKKIFKTSDFKILIELGKNRFIKCEILDHIYSISDLEYILLED